MREPGAVDAREAILDQLGYLLLEIEALEPIIGRVPEPLLSGRPVDGALSIKEMYGVIAAADEHVRLSNFQRMVTDDLPPLSMVDEQALARGADWNDMEMPAILRRVREAREALLSFLRALPPEEWTRAGAVGDARFTVYDVAYRITQADLDLLRALGQRLHESHLTTRVQDLPK